MTSLCEKCMPSLAEREVPGTPEIPTKTRSLSRYIFTLNSGHKSDLWLMLSCWAEFYPFRQKSDRLCSLQEVVDI